MYFPFGAIAAGGWQLAGKRGRVGPEAGARLWLVLLNLGFVVYAMGRSDFTHVFPLLMMSLALASVVLLAVAGLVPTPLRNFLDQPKAPRVVLPFARARGMFASAVSVDETSALIRALNEGEGERPRATYSGTTRHDVFMPNDPMLYFLSERNPGTYYWILDSGVTTTQSVQREMVDELEANNVQRLVLWDSFQIADAHPIAGANVLDQWLKAKFSAGVQVGRYSVLNRRP